MESHPPNEAVGPTKSKEFWEIQSVCKNKPLCLGNVGLLWLVAQGSQMISEQDTELFEGVGWCTQAWFPG